jgi:dethiobiotin synthase
MRIAAVKPMETGCDPVPQDAVALANACGDPSLAQRSGFYRARLPASPYAVELESEQVAPNVHDLERALVDVAADYQGVLVEGAGGLFVPINRTEVLADLVHALELPVLLVATDRLGVLSHVLASVEAATQRGIRIAALVLNRNQIDTADDPSLRTNRLILAQRLDFPVIEFPNIARADLADAASSTGLLRVALSELEDV